MSQTRELSLAFRDSWHSRVDSGFILVLLFAEKISTCLLWKMYKDWPQWSLRPHLRFCCCCCSKEVEFFPLFWYWESNSSLHLSDSGCATKLHSWPFCVHLCLACYTKVFFCRIFTCSNNRCPD